MSSSCSQVKLVSLTLDHVLRSCQCHVQPADAEFLAALLLVAAADVPAHVDADADVLMPQHPSAG